MKTVAQRSRKRLTVMVLSCLFVIFASVFLMNLESPGSTDTGEPTPIYKPVLAPSPPESAPHPSRADNMQSEQKPREPQPATGSEVGVQPLSAAASSVGNADLTYLGTRNLLIPVQGVAANQLHDSFYEGRSEGRTHEALDIMAPKDTPVLATTDGVIRKLHESVRGGIMIYEMDPSGLYVYYYGHLSRYADGLSENKQVKRGEIIGYVGDTGNAGAGNYHLHFGISKCSAPGKWYGGDPINPFPLLGGR